MCTRLLSEVGSAVVQLVPLQLIKVWEIYSTALTLSDEKTAKDMRDFASGKLTYLWKITIFSRKINYKRAMFNSKLSNFPRVEDALEIS